MSDELKKAIVDYINISNRIRGVSKMEMDTYTALMRSEVFNEEAMIRFLETSTAIFKQALETEEKQHN